MALPVILPDTLSDIYNKFKNREVEDTATDATLLELKQAVENKGFTLEVCKPFEINADGVHKDRVRAHVVASATKGKFRLSAFHIG